MCNHSSVFSSSSPLVHFDTMTCGPNKVRRLSTINSLLEPTFIHTTEWLWYWEDEFGKWNLYASSVSNYAYFFSFFLFFEIVGRKCSRSCMTSIKKCGQFPVIFESSSNWFFDKNSGSDDHVMSWRVTWIDEPTKNYFLYPSAGKICLVFF